MKSDYKVIIVIIFVIIGFLLGILVFDKVAVVAPQEVVYSPSSDTLSTLGSDTIDAPFSGEVHLQVFDPNTADEALLRSLGLSAFSVDCILKYRAKGGVFTTKEDVAQMYGITYGQYKRLEPYIVISPEYRPASEMVPRRSYNHWSTDSDTLVRPSKLSKGEYISLNSADTTELKRVPGIGSYYAKAIVNLRSRFGGFVSIAQLSAIEGIPESSFEYFIVPDGGVTPLNINTAEFKTLQTHPYIGYNRAKQICDYRRLKGKINSLEELALLPGFDADERLRLEPYVTF